MSKLLFLLLLAGAGTLFVMAGVLEIDFHWDNLNNVPVAARALAKDTKFVSKLYTQGIRAKRNIEVLVARDPDDKLAVMIKHVEQDVKKLIEQLDAKADPQEIIPRAGLLLEAVENLKEFRDSIRGDVLEKHNEAIDQALSQAAALLERLNNLQEEYEQYQQELGEVTSSLKEQTDIPLRF